MTTIDRTAARNDSLIGATPGSCPGLSTAMRSVLLESTYARRAASVQLDRDQLGNARLLHRHSVAPIGDLHRLPAVRDENELRLLLHAAQHLHEPADVGLIERRVDLV